jgi:hypothetical protein
MPYSVSTPHVFPMEMCGMEKEAMWTDRIATRRSSGVSMRAFAL